MATTVSITGKCGSGSPTPRGHFTAGEARETWGPLGSLKPSVHNCKGLRHRDNPVFLGNYILVKTPKMYLILCMTNTLQTGLGPTLVLIRQAVFP